MNKKKALAILQFLFEAEFQRLAVDANMFEKVGARYPLAVKAHKRREELKEAWAFIQKYFADN